MTQAQADALARMQAANAALTPEQRKQRSRDANAKRMAAKRKDADTKASAPVAEGNDAPMRDWLVAVVVAPETEGAAEKTVWVAVKAQGMRRAAKAARQEQPGTVVCIALAVAKGMVVGK